MSTYVPKTQLQEMQVGHTLSIDIKTKRIYAITGKTST